MTIMHAHPHAEFDRFPQLVDEFGSAAIDAVIDAEAADFAWDSRFAERNVGAWEGFDDDDDGGEIVRIIGYFRSRYTVATCVVDAQRHVRAMLRQRHFDSIESAEAAFLAGGE